MKLMPHDLSEVPDGKLSVSMLDDNFDVTRDNFTDIDSRVTSLTHLLEALSATVESLTKAFQSLTDANGPDYAKPRESNTVSFEKSFKPKAKAKK